MTRRTFAPDAGGLIAGAIMLTIGIGVTVTSVGYGIGSLRRMDTGYFPMLLGSCAILLGLAITVRHGLFPAPAEDAEPETIDWTERWHRLRPMLLVPLGIAAFAALLESAGLLIATFALVMISGLAAEKPNLKRLFVIALLTPVGAWAIFVLGFGLPFKLY
ncbi:tripartite tricarboxylate transporter TctB family protein [Salipiger abyssi]|nr:tripartite tricarboxylate transporter TctB family protein [Salipiger abyssi]